MIYAISPTGKVLGFEEGRSIQSTVNGLGICRGDAKKSLIVDVPKDWMVTFNKPIESGDHEVSLGDCLVRVTEGELEKLCPTNSLGSSYVHLYLMKLKNKLKDYNGNSWEWKK